MKRDAFRATQLLILAIAVCAIVAAIATYWTRFPSAPGTSPEQWGVFGDFLGGTLNPILAFLGLIALLVTISIQSRELSISSDELAKSAKALNDQFESQKRQTFESTFFSMVRLHHDLVRSLEVQEKVQGVQITGRDTFRIMFLEFSKLHGRANAKLTNEGSLRIAQQAYTEFFQRHENEVGHYFRNFHRVLKFVDEAEVDRKETYTGILRAQLSAYEQALLFYNAIHPLGSKLRPLIVQYEMLENLNIQHLRNPLDEVFLIDRKAYGDQDLTKYEPVA